VTRRTANTNRGRGDAGVTLVELVVSLAVMSIAFLVVGGVLISALTSSNRLQASSAAVDEGRRASARIDRELRSATCIREPAVGTPGDTLIFDTVADGPSHRVTYEVTGGQLTRQQDAGTAATVANGLVAGEPTFSQVATPLRTVQVGLTVASANGGTYRLTTTIAGRNAWRTCT